MLRLVRLQNTLHENRCECCDDKFSFIVLQRSFQFRYKNFHNRKIHDFIKCAVNTYLFSEVLSFHEILQKSFKTKTNETYFPKLVTEL